MHPFSLRFPHSNKRIFVKPLRVGMVHIHVPRRFDDHFGPGLDDFVELRDPVGNTFNVKFEYQFNKARFSDGISELRVVHQLESIVWIRFSYRRESRFDIKNFDGHLREIEYRIKQQVEEPGNSLDGNHSSLHSSEDKNIVDLVTEDECDNVVSKLQFHKLVWLPDISLAHMTGKRALIIPGCVQQSAFPKLPSEIKVCLPNGTWTQWQIVWHPICNSVAEDSVKPEMVGEIGGDWCDFLRDEFNRTGSIAANRMQVWRLPQPNSFSVHVFTC